MLLNCSFLGYNAHMSENAQMTQVSITTIMVTAKQHDERQLTFATTHLDQIS